MVNVHQAKARLSEYLDAVERGEQVWICKRNQPVAELRPLVAKRKEPRPLGGGPHTFAVPDTFFEPMSDEWLADFESSPVYPSPTSTRTPPSRAAERSPAFGARRKGRHR